MSSVFMLRCRTEGVCPSELKIVQAVRQASPLHSDRHTQVCLLTGFLRGDVSCVLHNRLSLVADCRHSGRAAETQGSLDRVRVGGFARD
jgi:hypothetical protein